jgi:hypothetical protein
MAAITAWEFFDFKRNVPGLVNIPKTIEHGPVEIVELAIKKWWIFP